MPTDTETSQSNPTENEEDPNLTSGSESNNSDENINEEDEEEKPIFHPHKGKIMQILPYKDIISISYDKSYEEPTGSGKVEMILEKDEDYKYIYDGVSCKLKIRRDTDRQFSDTGIEEIFKKEEDIQLREHYPTDEILLENQDIFKEKEFINKEYKNFDVVSTMVSRSASDDGLYGFVTEVTYESKGTTLSLKDWGYCLEDTTLELSFNGLFRSELLAEVIKSYGLTPIIDLSGLNDDVVMSWTNKKNVGGNSSEDNGGSASDSENYTQCSRTYDLSVNAKVNSKGDIPSDITDDMMGKIGKADTNYGEWAKGKTPQEIMQGLRSRFTYSRYSDNNDKCATDTFKDHIYANCGDSARLVKCCMDVIGVDCICIHSPGHYYNAIKIDGKWLTTDLTYGSSCKTKTGTNKFGY